MTNPYFSQTETPRSVRPPYRPPIGIPVEPAVGWRGLLSSLGVHALILLLVLLPALLHNVLPREVESAGGAGPAGGGGGGRGGTGGARSQERLQYIHVAPLAPTPPSQAVTAPPVIPPVLPPKPVPPQAVPSPVVPAPVTPSQAPADPAPAVPAASPVEGTGGGRGTDGSAGAGPGSGGGVGTGIGTGHGSSVGPGTGGGSGTVYTPQPLTVFIPPVPAPSKVRGREIVAEFDVDSTGRVLSVTFTPTGDGGYNKRLRELFAEMKWRPATKPDGTPVRAKATFAYTL